MASSSYLEVVQAIQTALRQYGSRRRCCPRCVFAHETCEQEEVREFKGVTAAGLSVNLTKTKVVTFGSKAACQAFLFNSNEVERVESYKYLGVEFHATKNLAHGVSQLVSSAKKAMHSMSRRCALLPISDPGLRCKLFDSLVLPILSYASEVWAVDDKIGDTAELLHRQFLKHLLGWGQYCKRYCTS